MDVADAGRLFASLVAPPLCPLCRNSCTASESLCARCDRRLAEVRPIVTTGPPGVALSAAAGPFEAELRALAIAIKFGRSLSLLSRAGEAMIVAAPPGLLAGAVVPVPAAPLRRLWRGFDPAEAIAAAVARASGLPLRACLSRRQGRRQVGRPRSLRLSAPPRVELVEPPPRRAVLVDDVHTTGATLAACAGALRDGCCERVVALTLARA